jgi:hypothetical protein
MVNGPYGQQSVATSKRAKNQTRVKLLNFGLITKHGWKSNTPWVHNRAQFSFVIPEDCDKSTLIEPWCQFDLVSLCPNGKGGTTIRSYWPD